MDVMRKIFTSPLSRRRCNATGPSESTVTTAVSNGGSSETTTMSDTYQGNSTDSGSPRRRYFGVELGELVSRDGTDVPRLLLRLARCICNRGS